MIKAENKTMGQQNNVLEQNIQTLRQKITRKDHLEKCEKRQKENNAITQKNIILE